jgi:hypothetical protein
MQHQLDANGIDFDRDQHFDPDELLPQWAHPRKIA